MDRAWAQLKPLLPGNDGRSQQWWDHRQTLNDILGELRTGASWRDPPAR